MSWPRSCLHSSQNARASFSGTVVQDPGGEPLEKAIVQAVSGELQCVSYTEVSDGETTLHDHDTKPGAILCISPEERVLRGERASPEDSGREGGIVECRSGCPHRRWRGGRGRATRADRVKPLVVTLPDRQRRKCRDLFPLAKRIDTPISLFTALGPTNTRRWPRPMSRMGRTWTPMLKSGARGGGRSCRWLESRLRKRLLQTKGRRAIKSGRILRSAGY